MYYKITKAIENCYKKRVEKGIDKQSLENWLNSLKENWKKNPDILKFISKLGKEKEKYTFVIEGEGKRKKLVTSNYDFIEQEWTQRAIEGQEQNGGYLKTWFEILENEKRIFRCRFDLVGKFEELSLYYFLKDVLFKYYKNDKEKMLLKVLAIVYSKKFNVDLEKVTINLIQGFSGKEKALIIDHNKNDNMADILQRWQEKEQEQIICKSFNFESEV